MFVFNSIKHKLLCLARLIFYDMLNGTRIKNKYFFCSYDKIKEVFEKIEYYFKNYCSSEKIKKAYLYEHI